MRSIGQIFEIPNLKVCLFEPFIVKAINLSLNPNTYPMIVAMCLNMLAKPVLDDSDEFMRVIEKCALVNSLSVSWFFLENRSLDRFSINMFALDKTLFQLK
jgi:hypothetical protein